MYGLFTSTGCLKIFRILFTTKFTVSRPTQYLRIMIMIMITIMIMIFSRYSGYCSDFAGVMIMIIMTICTCQAIPLKWFGMPRRTSSFTFKKIFCNALEWTWTYLKETRAEVFQDFNFVFVFVLSYSLEEYLKNIFTWL